MRGAILSVLALAGLASAVGCRRDMRVDARIKPLQESTFFADRTSSRLPVAGTVAQGQARADALLYRGEIDGHLVRGLPFPVTREVLETGRTRYNIYCSVCHGATGAGDGMIVQRGFPAPPSFHDLRLRQAPEGHFFYVITNGYGVMYSYASRVEPNERWAIVAYIRALQLARSVDIASLPTEEQSRLSKP